jgi:hypothetical protein
MSTDLNSQVSEQVKDLRASLGFVKDYYKLNPSVDPKYAPAPSRGELDAYLEIYRKDSIVSGAIDTVAEESIRNGFYIIGSKSAKEKAVDVLEELNFLDVCEVHVRTLHIYGNSYIEFKYGDSGKLEELHNLETTEMFILYNKHGDVIGYEQDAWNLNRYGGVEITDQIQKWQPDQIFFMPLKRLGSKVYGYFPLEPALRAITARLYAHYLLQSVFQNFKPQTIVSVDQNISPAQTQSLIHAFQAADKDPSKKILSVGETKVTTTGVYDFKKDLVDILNYFRQEILTVTKVPGIYVGITDNSNRGVGEFEANAFQAHLLKLHKQLEKLGNEVLKRRGIKAKLKMKPPSIKSQSDIIDQAKKLRDMGYGDDVITPFLFENGIDVPEDAEFEQEAQMSMDDYESRQGSGKGVTEGKYKLDESGRSAAGKAKMAQQDKSVRAAVVEEPSVFTKMVQRVREWKLH